MSPRDIARPDVDALLLVEALDSLAEGIQVLSREWRYLYVNEAVARHGRKSPRDLLGKTMLDCYPGIERTPVFEVLDRCMRERRADVLENEFVYEDGQRAWFELRIRPCRAGLIVASLDVTDRKRIEARLAEAHRQALRELVTPVISVHEGVLLVPIVGSLHRERASHMTESVLERVAATAAKCVIFDVAGVPALDTGVAELLLQTTAMIRLLGASCILTGISAPAAKAIVQLGVDLSTMRTTTHLAEGIELARAIARGAAPR